MFIRTLLVLLCFIGADAAASDDPLAELKKGQPNEVIALIDRLVGCNHWSGEEPYDAERKREIASAIAQLQCARLQKDEAAMRKRYAKRPSTIKVLDRAKEMDY